MTDQHSGCPSISDLEDYRSGSVDGDAARRVAEHLDNCAGCRDQIVELKRLDGLSAKLRSATPRAGLPQIPGYRVERELHRGGQGVVFAAVQESTGRLVAVKVLLYGVLASARERARFDREVETAARVRHPNVVAIVDRGATEDGRAFYAMELVDGQTLDRYLKDAELTVEKKLGVFASVCDGVAAAHRHGVLHRDLKPQNIVVAENGSPMVLDFGLARDEAGDAHVAARTVTGEFMGTLAYASPEQLSGDPAGVDARTDVYSLGVVLYEMLTGAPPYDVDGPIDKAVQAVTQLDGTKPSSLVKGLPADLDVIVAHAMEKDPSRRYQSVDGLGEDVRRAMADLPILARRATTRYQLKKFARRHRAAVGVAAAVLVGLLATVAALSVGIVRTNDAKRTAEGELQKQEAISTFFRSLLAEVDPGQSGPEMRVTELLDVASGRIDAGFEPYPELRGALQMTVGETYARLGSYEEAQARLRAALDAMDELGERPDAEYAATLGVLGSVLTSVTRLDEAEPVLTEAAAIAEGVGDTYTLAQVTHELGALEDARGHFEEAIGLYERSIEIIGADDSEAADRLRAQALIGTGVACKRLERFEEALTNYDRALAILAVVRPENHPDTLACLSNRAEVLRDLGRDEESLALKLDLLERRRAVFGPTHERVGVTLNNIADHLSGMERFEEASARFDEAIAIFRENPGGPSLRVAITLHNAGVMSLDQEDWGKAEQRLTESAGMVADLLPAEHWIPAQFDVKLAECLMRTGRAAEARPMLVAARETLAGALGEEHRRVRFVDELLGSEVFE